MLMIHRSISLQNPPLPVLPPPHHPSPNHLTTSTPFSFNYTGSLFNIGLTIKTLCSFQSLPQLSPYLSFWPGLHTLLFPAVTLRRSSEHSHITPQSETITVFKSHLKTPTPTPTHRHCLAFCSPHSITVLFPPPTCVHPIHVSFLFCSAGHVLPWFAVLINVTLISCTVSCPCVSWKELLNKMY